MILGNSLYLPPSEWGVIFQDGNSLYIYFSCNFFFAFLDSIIFYCFIFSFKLETQSYDFLPNEGFTEPGVEICEAFWGQNILSLNIFFQPLKKKKFWPCNTARKKIRIGYLRLEHFIFEVFCTVLDSGLIWNV